KTRKAGATSKSKSKASSSDQVEKASLEAFKKLHVLGIEKELQNDLEWCIGSFRADGNPVGLYAMVERAITVFKAEQGKKTKGVTSKLIADLEKVIQNR